MARQKSKLRVAIALLALSWCQPANSQSLTPMRGKVKSVTDSFAVRVHATNPYEHRIKVKMSTFDDRFSPVRSRIRPQVISLGGGASRSILVQVPFEEHKNRRIRICAESVPFPNRPTIMKAMICGKFLATRLR